MWANQTNYAVCVCMSPPMVWPMPTVCFTLFDRLHFRSIALNLQHKRLHQLLINVQQFFTFICQIFHRRKWTGFGCRPIITLFNWHVQRWDRLWYDLTESFVRLWKKYSQPTLRKEKCSNAERKNTISLYVRTLDTHSSAAQTDAIGPNAIIQEQKHVCTCKQSVSSCVLLHSPSIYSVCLCAVFQVCWHWSWKERFVSIHHIVFWCRNGKVNIFT